MSVGAVNKQTGERIPTAGMPPVDSVLSSVSTNPVQNRVVKAALDEKADTDMVAADFDVTASYTAVNYCVQDGKLYKFKNNHSGAWSSADVDEVKITGELSALKSGLTNLLKVDTTLVYCNNVANTIKKQAPKAVTGYKPIAIVGYSPYGGFAPGGTINTLMLDGDGSINISWSTAHATTLGVTVLVLYVKDYDI